MRISRTEMMVCLLIVVIPVLGHLGSEFRWSKINNPKGRFSSVAEYLKAGRLPSRVVLLNTNGSNFFIAYSPMDSWLAIPSGPAAYVFDPSGQMIRWSRDTGDDPDFHHEWPLRQQQQGSIDDLRRIGFQPSGPAKGSLPIAH